MTERMNETGNICREELFFCRLEIYDENDTVEEKHRLLAL